MKYLILIIVCTTITACDCSNGSIENYRCSEAQLEQVAKETDLCIRGFRPNNKCFERTKKSICSLIPKSNKKW